MPLPLTTRAHHRFRIESPFGSSVRNSSSNRLEQPATSRTPSPSAQDDQSGQTKQHEERGAGYPEQPLEPRDETTDPVVPRLVNARPGWHGWNRSFPGLHERHRESSVGGFVVEDRKLALELLDLALQGVELALDRQDVADRSRLSH